MNRIKELSKWTNEDLDILREKYPTMNTDELAKLLGRSRQAVVLKANRIGVKKPHHTQNDSYFDDVDSATVAYWLGFLSADGYVNYSPTGGTYEVGIELASKDEEHLVNFLRDINSSGLIYRREKSPFVHKGYNNSYKESSVRIYSKHMVESLNKYGIINSKTYSITFPDNIPKNYVWDYIRGFFDGDGSVFVNDVQSCSGKIFPYIGVNFTAYSKEFLLGIRDKLLEESISPTINKANKNSDSYQLYIRKQEDVAKFFRLIYPSSSVRKLERKYIKFINFYSEKLPA